eukprot:Lithocolla_globosa_v1_NODE_1757_length_2360_cov_9.253796.p2 type:complete len:119 gc:universal NODE_1757_length_2360_cov_9.253796:651-295(-)
MGSGSLKEIVCRDLHQAFARPQLLQLPPAGVPVKTSLGTLPGLVHERLDVYERRQSNEALQRNDQSGKAPYHHGKDHGAACFAAIQVRARHQGRHRPALHAPHGVPRRGGPRGQVVCL